MNANRIILERNVIVDVDEAVVRERIEAYFARSGYTQAISQPCLMTYRRGRFLAFSPKKWKVYAVIQIVSDPGQPTRVAAAFDIDTTGQVVIERERRFWKNELNDFEQAVKTGKGG
jgi:hypothetical protein